MRQIHKARGCIRGVTVPDQMQAYLQVPAARLVLECMNARHQGQDMSQTTWRANLQPCSQRLVCGRSAFLSNLADQIQMLCVQAPRNGTSVLQDLGT